MELEEISDETPGCRALHYSTDFQHVWMCVQVDCDGEHHYFRRLVWMGPFLGPDEGPLTVIDGDGQE